MSSDPSNPEPEIPFTPLYINNLPVRSSTASTFPVYNPSEPHPAHPAVGIAASASASDCLAAVLAAAAAFTSWEHVPLTEKRDLFLNALRIVDGEAWRRRVVQTMAREIDAVEYWGVFNWGMVLGGLKSCVGLTAEMKGEWRESVTSARGEVVLRRRAKGVVLSVSPWNAPFALAFRAVAIAIFCGNTVVLKSSERSPQSQALLVELFIEAGLPPGVLNFVSVAKEDAPARTAEMIARPEVRLLTFSGSDRVGRILAIEAAKHLKPCILELGGKAPTIVLNDANIEEAARAIVFGGFAHSGQVCMSTERVVVERGVSEELVSSVQRIAGALKAGRLSSPYESDQRVNEPTAKEPKTLPPRLGALFSEDSAENVVRLVREAKEAGATVLLGDVARAGSLVQPHIVLGVKPGMSLWEDESFGPVIAFAIVDSMEEAIELANDSKYSLASAVWTSDIYKAQEFVARIRAGYVNINGSTIHSEPSANLIGLGGASGYGRFDVEHFTDKRVVITHALGKKYPLFS